VNSLVPKPNEGRSGHRVQADCKSYQMGTLPDVWVRVIHELSQSISDLLSDILLGAYSAVWFTSLQVDVDVNGRTK